MALPADLAVLLASELPPEVSTPMLPRSSDSSDDKAPGIGSHNKSPPKIFRFRDLPPEIRDKIYEYCVVPSGLSNKDNAITDHHQGSSVNQAAAISNQPSQANETPTGISSPERNIFIVTNKLPHRSFPFPSSISMAYHTLNPILSTSHQLRSEALPIFYQTNTFAFPDLFAVFPWLLEVCTENNLKHIRSLHVEFTFPLHAPQIGILCALILLMEIGVLRCELHLVSQSSTTPLSHDTEIDVHFGCKLQKDVARFVASRKITRENVPRESIGLVRLVQPLVGFLWPVRGLGEVCEVCEKGEPGEREVVLKSGLFGVWDGEGEGNMNM